MKGKKIIIISMILNILLIGIIYNFIKKDYLNNKKIIVKPMTETEYEEYITALNISHEDYAKNIDEGKKKIASALTEMGVTTSDEETLENMANNIKSIDRNGFKVTDLIAKNHFSPYVLGRHIQTDAIFEYDSDSGYMKLTRKGTKECTVYTYSIDVTNFNSLKLTVKNKTDETAKISVGISKSELSDAQEFYSESTGTTVEFDLTPYSGTYHIGIRNWTVNSSFLIEKLELI